MKAKTIKPNLKGPGPIQNAFAGPKNKTSPPTTKGGIKKQGATAEEIFRGKKS